MFTEASRNGAAFLGLGRQDLARMPEPTWAVAFLGLYRKWRATTMGYW